MSLNLKEAAGVPKGIVDAGEKLYNDFKQKVVPMLKDGQTEYEVNFKPSEPYKIGDEEISDVEINIPEGKTIAIVGESGSGKTLTALSILGLNPNSSIIQNNSQIIFDKKDLTKIP